jgi:hypothetical protein
MTGRVKQSFFDFSDFTFLNFIDIVEMLLRESFLKIFKETFGKFN